MTRTAIFRGGTGTAEIRLTVEECCNCGVAFAMPLTWQRHYRDDPARWFYCPAGHRQHYTESEVERKLRQAEERLAAERGWSAELSSRLASTDRRLSATKAVVTRQRNRAAAGLCPCCNRHFTAMERHMATKHPEYKGEAAE